MKTCFSRMVMIVVAMLATLTANAQWTQVGDTLGSVNSVGETRIAFGPNDEPCVAYQRDAEYVIRKYNGLTWEQLGSPAIYFGNSSFGFAIDKNGSPYLATDTFDGHGYKLIVIKYDGNSWMTVGDPSRFRIQYTAAHVTSIVFDSSGFPCVAFGTAAVVRYNGSSWDEIAGNTVKDEGIGQIISDPNGKLYLTAATSKVFRYVSDTTWKKEDTTGLSIVPRNTLQFTIGPSGTHYVELFDIYNADSTRMFQYSGSKWIQMGSNFLPRVGLAPLFGSSAAAYVLDYTTTTLLRYNGRTWIAVDTSGIVSQLKSYGTPSSDASGNIYVIIGASSLGSSPRVMKYDTHKDALAVQGLAQAGTVTISPVPAENAVVIRNSCSALNGEPAIVTDIQGRVVSQFNLVPLQHIDISKWPAGRYFLRLPDGKVMTMMKE